MNDGGCGATACDESGACVYPSAATACGPPCASSSSKNTSTCDGKGGCIAGASDCAPYACSAGVCFTRCTDNTECEPGLVCDPAYSLCCAGPTQGGKLAADSNAGNDSTACCGTGGNGPCQSLTRAMQLIEAARAPNVTLAATVDGGGGDWNALELYPVVLGWGVEVNAPGVYFHDPFDELEIFDISELSGGAAGDGGGYASIVGAPGTPVWIGPNQAGAQSRDSSVIQIETGNALYLANANLNGSAIFQSTAITVNGGASLVLGQDRSATVTGTVTIGNSLANIITDGWNGIVCGVDVDAGTGCTVRDAPIGQSSLVIEGQENWDLSAADLAAVSLSSAPVFGLAPAAAGFGTCPAKPDARASGSSAILLVGRAQMTLANAMIQCIASDGIDLVAEKQWGPLLTMTGSTLQNIGGAALYAVTGSANISSSTLQYNYFGAWQDAQGTIDLSGGGGTNTVVCSSESEATTPEMGAVGIGVVNTSALGLNLDARNVAWDSVGPNIYSCTPDRFSPPRDLSNCLNFKCQSLDCMGSPGADGMDGVYDATGIIVTSGHQLATLTCDGH